LFFLFFIVVFVSRGLKNNFAFLFLLFHLLLFFSFFLFLRHQSPIDVRTHISTSGLEQANVRYDPYLADIVLKYDPIGPLILRNKGHVIDIPVSDVKNVTNINNYNVEGTWTLTHGTREYTLETMAFHVAGEHTLDGKRPDMELHLVHTAKGGKVTGAARNVLTLVVPFFVAINNNDDDKSDNFLDLFWDDIPPAGEQQVLDQTSLNVVAALFPSPTGTTGNPTEVKVTSDAFYA
jgi:carbonic anhydrase